jgi:hypothetical protein
VAETGRECDDRHSHVALDRHAFSAHRMNAPGSSREWPALSASRAAAAAAPRAGFRSSGCGCPRPGGAFGPAGEALR